jgi:hypothetical protein
MCTKYFTVVNYFKFSRAIAFIWHSLSRGKLTLYGSVLNSVAHVTLVRKVAHEVITIVFFKTLQSEENKGFLSK